LNSRRAIDAGDALRTLWASGTRGASNTCRTLRTGRTSGAWRANRAGGTSVAGDARGVTAEQSEEIETIVGRHARGDRRGKCAGQIVAEDDDFSSRDANSADGRAVDDLARVGDMTNDRTGRAVRLGDDAHGLLAACEGGNNRREAIAINVRRRDEDLRLNTRDRRAWDVADESAVADACRATGAIDHDRVV
jgi:hypothetical protein